MKYYQLLYKNFNERDLFYFSTNYIEKNTFKSKILINIKKFSKKKNNRLDFHGQYLIICTLENLVT